MKTAKPAPKDRTRRATNISVRVPALPVERLKYICKVTRLSQSRAVEEMITTTFKAIRKEAEAASR